jgi:hypothetical protein
VVFFVGRLAYAAAPERAGFTGDLGLGIAVTTVPQTESSMTCMPASSGSSRCLSEESTTRGAKVGLAGLSLSLGGYLSPAIALLFRIAPTSYFEDRTQFIQSFYGPVVEVWPHDRFFLSGGVGFALYGPNPLFSQSSEETRASWGLDFRVGAALVNSRRHAFTLSFEFIPGFYKKGNVMGYALVAAWKWY